MTFRTCLGLSAVEETSLRSSLYVAVVFLSLLSTRLEPPSVSQGILTFACFQFNQCNPHPVGFIWHHLTSTWHCLSPCYLGYYWKRVCCKHTLVCSGFSCCIFLAILMSINLKAMPQTYYLLLLALVSKDTIFFSTGNYGCLHQKKSEWFPYRWKKDAELTSEYPGPPGSWLIAECLSELYCSNVSKKCIGWKTLFLEKKDKALWDPWGQLCPWHHYRSSF